MTITQSAVRQSNESGKSNISDEEVEFVRRYLQGHSLSRNQCHVLLPSIRTAEVVLNCSYDCAYDAGIGILIYSRERKGHVIGRILGRSVMSLDNGELEEDRTLIEALREHEIGLRSRV